MMLESKPDPNIISHTQPFITGDKFPVKYLVGQDERVANEQTIQYFILMHR